MINQKVYKILYKKYLGEYFDNNKTSKALGYFEKNYYCEMFYDAVNQADDEKSKCILKKMLSSKGYLNNYVFIEAFCKCCLEKDASKRIYFYETTLIKDLSDNIKFTKKSDWEKILYLILSQRMYRLALCVRNKFIDFLKVKGKFRDRYSVCIENGEYKQAEAMLKKSIKLKILKAVQHPNFYRYYNSLPTWKKARGNDEYLDKEFKSYIKDKRILIIGPSDNGEIYEINPKYDVVVRFACFEGEADISYYNGLHSVRMENNGTVPEGVKFCVFKYRRQNSFRNNLYEKKVGRMARWSLMMMLSGCSPNMLQVALADLLHYTDKIEVRDNNLYLNNIYKEGYASNELLKNMNGYKKNSMFAQHDILGNFRYTSSLFRNGFFSADSKLTNILNMTEEEYAYQMECNNLFVEG